MYNSADPSITSKSHSIFRTYYSRAIRQITQKRQKKTASSEAVLAHLEQEVIG
jgi:hypothetical protein